MQKRHTSAEGWIDHGPFSAKIRGTIGHHKRGIRDALKVSMNETTRTEIFVTRAGSNRTGVTRVVNQAFNLDGATKFQSDPRVTEIQIIVRELLITERSTRPGAQIARWSWLRS